MHDLILLAMCIVSVGWCALAIAVWKHHKRQQAVKWAAKNLMPHRERLLRQRKILTEQEDRFPTRPKTAFMRAHLERQLQRFNAIAEQINTEGRKR